MKIYKVVFVKIVRKYGVRYETRKDNGIMLSLFMALNLLKPLVGNGWVKIRRSRRSRRKDELPNGALQRLKRQLSTGASGDREKERGKERKRELIIVFTSRVVPIRRMSEKKYGMHKILVTISSLWSF